MKSKKISWLILGVVFLLVFSLFGCLPGAAPEPEPDPDPKPDPEPVEEEIMEMEFGIASAYEPGHIFSLVADKVKTLVEERSDGRITVNLFPGGVMGGEAEILEVVVVGGIEMTVSGPANGFFTPEYAFFNNPFIMKDWDHFLRLWDGPLGAEAMDALREVGIVYIPGEIYVGMRQFTADKPIRTIDDLAGLKLRLPVIDTWVSIWGEAGALPVPVPLHELYTALTTGVADASEGPAEQLYSFKLFEVQDYFSITNHLLSAGHFSAGVDWWDGLNEPTRELIAEAIQEASDWGSEKSLGREAELLVYMVEEHGATVIGPEEVDRDSFLEAVRPTIEGLFETHWPVTTWEEVLAQ
ncbi:TRAP transporter substrate-binding protein [candidate division NPL-UPA2 bacterium]|nr:TRAP transporter substrate-binding protein [candidate division NPL-UPA2 bacterium]